MNSMLTPTVVVEVACQAPRQNWPELTCLIRSFVRSRAAQLFPGKLLPLDDAPPLLVDAIQSVRVCDMAWPGAVSTTGATTAAISSSSSSSNRDPYPSHCFADDGTAFHIVPFLYALHGAVDGGCAGPAASCTTTGGSGQPSQPPLPPSVAAFMRCDEALDADDNGLPFCATLPLPHASLDGLWEALSYGETMEASMHLKRELVEYVYTALHFSRAGVSPHQITWNRLILFHGPPGTGKTSLCKGLAQKLSIRLANIFVHGAVLVEVNAHSLFSRWFSESGKQVMQLFQRILRIAEDADQLVCVLLDEVESLAAARQSAMKGNEPSDSIRVVNALLTQIDRLQHHRNVLLLATSNLTEAIDDAFLDRADKKVRVGPPGLEARRAMLLGSVMELLEKGLLYTTANTSSSTASVPTTGCAEELQGRSSVLANHEATQAEEGASADDAEQPPCAPHFIAEAVSEVEAIAAYCDGLNGRTLRKLPFIAYGACLSALPSQLLLTTTSPSFSSEYGTKRGGRAGAGAGGGGGGGDSGGSDISLPLSLFLDRLREMVMVEKHRSNEQE